MAQGDMWVDYGEENMLRLDPNKQPKMEIKDRELRILGGDDVELMKVTDKEVEFTASGLLVDGRPLKELLSDLWAAIEQVRIDLERVEGKLDGK